MKAKALQFGKAMGAALFVLLLSVAGMKNALAQTLVATLQHGDSIRAFYGPGALSSAHSAAETGDIITLSSGTFYSLTITKAVTIRGAGIVSDTAAGTFPTIINEDVTANFTNDTAYLTIEGVSFRGTFLSKRLKNPRFVRCYFETFNAGNTDNITPMTSSQFVNCRIKNLHLRSSGSYYASNTNFINCVIWTCTMGGNYMVAYNSYIGLGCYPTSAYHTMSVYNCIVYAQSNNNYYKLNSYSNAFNCIGINGALGDAYKENCWTYSLHSNVFETFTNSNINYYAEPLILKEEIATTCLGNDGTQVGIYGGFVPYSYIPSYLLRTHITVPNRSNIDGTLNVDVEIIEEDE